MICNAFFFSCIEMPFIEKENLLFVIWHLALISQNNPKNPSNKTQTVSGSIVTMLVYCTGVITHVLSKQPLKYVLKQHACEYINKQICI